AAKFLGFERRQDESVYVIARRAVNVGRRRADDGAKRPRRFKFGICGGDVRKAEKDGHPRDISRDAIHASLRRYLECGALPPLLFFFLWYCAAKRKTKAAVKRRTPK